MKIRVGIGRRRKELFIPSDKLPHIIHYNTKIRVGIGGH